MTTSGCSPVSTSVPIYERKPVDEHQDYHTFLDVLQSSLPVIDALPDRYQLRIQRSIKSLKPKKSGASGTDVQKLYKWLLTTSTQHLFRPKDFSSHAFRVLIVGHIQKDGMGDFYHMLHAAETIQTLFPNASIMLGGEVEHLSERLDKFPQTSFITHLWGVSYKGFCRLTHENREHANEQMLACQTWADGSSSSLVIHMPHSAYTAYLEDIWKLDSIRIYEYGGLAEKLRDKIYSELGNYGMGVSPFETGLIWKNHGEERLLLTDIKNDFLRELLCGSDQEDRYHENSILHYAYGIEFNIDNSVKIFLSYDEADPRENIDVVHNSNLFSGSIAIIAEFCGGRDIQSIEVWQDGKQTLRTVLQESGKRLRLINPGLILNKDVLCLISHSAGKIAGCTGDLSFSEVLSLDGIPLYDTRLHKRVFSKTMLTLVSEYFGTEDSPAVKLFQLNQRGVNLSTEDCVALGKLFRTERFLDEMARFRAYLKKHHNFNKTLGDIVARKVALATIPGLKETEESLVKSFTQNEKSLKECLEEYSKAFSSQQ